jgi:hypothetical protein
MALESPFALHDLVAIIEDELARDRPGVRDRRHYEHGEQDDVVGEPSGNGGAVFPPSFARILTHA